MVPAKAKLERHPPARVAARQRLPLRFEKREGGFPDLARLRVEDRLARRWYSRAPFGERRVGMDQDVPVCRRIGDRRLPAEVVASEPLEHGVEDETALAGVEPHFR